MFVRLLQLAFIMHSVVKACFPSGIFSSKKQCDSVDCLKDQKNVTANINAFHDLSCPEKLDSATEVSGKLYIFSGGKVWIFKERRPETALPVGKLFAKSPRYVNASVTIKHHTYLIEDRIIYAFELDKTTGIFKLRKGWPKKLQNRVLFFPQAAFPIKNDSVIVISGDVFATYDFENNKASLVNDLKIYYPNLPDNFRTGIPFPDGQFETYHLFDTNTVYDYDMNIHQITYAQPIKKYLSC